MAVTSCSPWRASRWRGSSIAAIPPYLDMSTNERKDGDWLFLTCNVWCQGFRPVGGRGPGRLLRHVAFLALQAPSRAGAFPIGSSLHGNAGGTSYHPEI